jgi:hypothetical protein
MLLRLRLWLRCITVPDLMSRKNPGLRLFSLARVFMLGAWMKSRLSLAVWAKQNCVAW